MASTERKTEIDGVEVAWRERGDAPLLYLHGVPNSSVMWEPFLERTGGIALDLPGFGDSAKPADFPYSVAGYGRVLERFAHQRGLDRVTLVMHDWGAVGLALAQSRPELVERVVIIAGVPLLPGYHWHKYARAWRRPFVGEMAMGLTFRWNLRRVMPDELVDDAWRHFDHGTQRAILKLYRSAPERALAEAGTELGQVTAPALVVWGEADPFIPAEFADLYAEALGGPTTVERTEGAGHWAWVDHPAVVDRVAAFAS